MMYYPDNIDFGNQEPQEVMRRVSKVTSECSSLSEQDLSEKDIRRDYQNAVECLIKCESLIKDLSEEVASKDETIKILEEKIFTRDERIASLEERLIVMSLELALSKALEDEHLLLTRKMLNDSSRSDSYEESSSAAIKRIEQGAAKVFIETEPEDKLQWHESLARSTSNCPKSKQGGESSATWKDSRNRPTSNCRKNLATHHSWSRFASNWGGGDSPHDPIVKECFTAVNTSKMSSFTASKNSQTSLRSTHSSGRRNSDNSNTKRFANFGQLLRRNRGIHNGEDMQVQFPDKAVLDDEKKELQDDTIERPAYPTAAQRRLPSRKRSEMQKSSRSFLEAKGVVFPVSSFEVLNKGCLLAKSITMKQGRAAGSNDVWQEF